MSMIDMSSSYYLLARPYMMKYDKMYIFCQAY